MAPFIIGDEMRLHAEAFRDLLLRQLRGGAVRFDMRNNSRRQGALHGGYYTTVLYVLSRKLVTLLGFLSYNDIVYC